MKKAKYIINAGSVGQPRDGDNKACYIIYDTDQEEISFKRVAYNYRSAMSKIIKAGLPEYLAYRLQSGR